MLRRTFPKATRQQILNLLPTRSWWAIEAKGRELGLRRPAKTPISANLFRPGDIGFSAGMIIADGSVIELLIASGRRRAKLDGGRNRMMRYYSMPHVQVSMEDRESLTFLARMWGKRVSFCQRSSVGNDVWRVYVHGQKAYDLLKAVLPYLHGDKRRKALYLLAKYRGKTSLPILDPGRFLPFGGMK